MLRRIFPKTYSSMKFVTTTFQSYLSIVKLVLEAAEILGASQECLNNFDFSEYGLCSGNASTLR